MGAGQTGKPAFPNFAERRTRRLPPGSNYRAEANLVQLLACVEGEGCGLACACVWVHACVHVRMHAATQARTRECGPYWARMCVLVCMHVCLCMRVCVCACVCVCMRVSPSTHLSNLAERRVILHARPEAKDRVGLRDPAHDADLENRIGKTVL